MNLARIGIFTLESLNVPWFSHVVVRGKSKLFFSCRLFPHSLSFFESCEFSSLFQFPETSLIKSRQFLELRDGTCISAIQKTEFFSSAFLLILKSDKLPPIKDQNRISFFMRTHPVAICDSTLFTFYDTIFHISIPNRKTGFCCTTRTTPIKFELQPKSFIQYPSLTDVEKKLSRLVSFSLKHWNLNLHPRGCVLSGSNGRSSLCKKVSQSLSLSLFEIDFSTFDQSAVRHSQLSKIFPPKSLVLMKNFIFSNSVVYQICQMIDTSNQTFFVILSDSLEVPNEKLFTARRIGSVIVIPPLSNEDILVLPPEKLVKPQKITSAIPITKWDQIGGHRRAKVQIQEIVEWPFKRQHEFKKFAISPVKGILLYGPPGCGKTLIARAIASSINFSFFSFSPSSIFQMYLGESEKTVKEIFELARRSKPSAIFFDEFESIVGKRELSTGVSERVLSTFLNEMDGFSQLEDVLVIAATNMKENIDSALLRPGRFDAHFEIGPTESLDETKEILDVYLKQIPINTDFAESVVEKLGVGVSGACIENLCREASLISLHESAEFISEKHFDEAFKKIKNNEI